MNYAKSYLHFKNPSCVRVKKEVFEYTYFMAFILFIVLFFTGMMSNITGMTLVVIDNADPNSMYPTYYQGDLFVIRDSSPEDYHLGDVVVYENVGGEKVIHRIIDVVIDQGEYFYRIKGDNPQTNANPDTYAHSKLIPYSIILGKIIYRIPYLGHLSLAMQRNAAVRIFVYMTAIIVAAAIVFWPGDEDEDEKKENYIEITRISVSRSLTMLGAFPIELIQRISRNKWYLLTGVAMLVLLIAPTFIPSLLSTNYSHGDIGIKGVEVSSQSPLVDITQDSEFEGIFMQAKVIIFDNAGYWENVKGYTLEVFTESNNANTRISMTKWTSIHDFKGTIVVGGSIIFDKADIPLVNTTLYITATLKVRELLKTKDYTFQTSFEFTPS
ncbi:MAG: signal peptidase I [Candidatus Kariarchaeaceae archaeon]